MPITNKAFFWCFKNHATAHNFISNFHTSGHTINYRMSTNAMVLSNAKNFIYSKSKNDIRVLNETLREYYAKFKKHLHKTYNPFIHEFKNC